MNSSATPLRKPAPVGILCALLLSGLASFASLQMWRHLAPALQAYYLPAYARESLLPHLAFGRAAHRPRRYLAVYHDAVLATDETLAMNPANISVRSLFAQPSQFTAWLRAAIYHGNTVPQVLRTPLIGSVVCLFVFLFIGVAFDAQRLQTFRRGRKLRGPTCSQRFGSTAASRVTA